MRSAIAVLVATAVLSGFAKDAKSTWAKGMDDDAGRAAATRVDLMSLPGAEKDGQATTWPVRDRLYTQSLDGTWNFKLIKGLVVSNEDWASGFEPIEVPGNWETQGFRNPTYGNQIPELSGLYEKRFRVRKTDARNAAGLAADARYVLRFDGVLFACRVWLNGKFVGAFGSAFQMAQWDVTDMLIAGPMGTSGPADGWNVLRVQVMTRSKGWLFDTNDCWNLAGIQRSVELYTVPKRAAIEDITFTYADGKVDVTVKAAGEYAKVYVSLVDEDGLHVADSECAREVTRTTVGVANPHLWSPDDPYLYDLVVTIVDQDGKKIQRVSQKVGLRTVKLDGLNLLVNGKKTFLNGVAWNEIDPKEGRAISYRTRRENMLLMKKAHVNAIRTAHYPFGPDFYDLADEMGFFIIDEVPFGSRGRELLGKATYQEELLNRTRNTIARDKNHPSIVFWTFGNENPWTKNTAACLALAKTLDPTRPRGLPQIGSSQFHEMLFHPERDVDFISGHYLNNDRMQEAEKNAKKPMMQTEFAHACGNGFCDFERPYSRMRRNPDKWLGGCVWAWIDQSVMHPYSEIEEGLKFRNLTDLPKDQRRDMPAEFQGNFLDAGHFIDSWGDRATDGIVYGDGTPKDGYWLMKKLYGADDKFFRRRGLQAASEKEGEDSADDAACRPRLQPTDDAACRPRLQPTDDAACRPRLPQLRIGRKMGLDQRIQSIRTFRGTYQEPYIVDPEVQPDGTVRYYLSQPTNRTQWIEGTVTMREEDGKTVVAYDLKPNKAAEGRDMLEVGLVFPMPAEATRVDWAGLGPLTSVPSKSLMNDFGTWSMHKDDYRFIGPRAEVVYALARKNGGATATVLESGTGEVSFENIGGTIYLTECAHVAGYGGKGGPSGTRKLKVLKLKGAVKLYEAKVDPNAPDTVPDLTYTHHYGF